MKTYYYSFQLSRVHCIETRSRGNMDITLISFGVMLNSREQGRGTSLAPMWSGTATGGTVLRGEEISEAALANGHPTSSVNMHKNWTIGPLQIGDGDAVDILVTGTNTIESVLPSADQAVLDKWTIKALNAYYSWLLGKFASGLGLEPAMEYIAPTAGTAIAEFLNDPVGTLLGYDPPGMCNGLVFADSMHFSAAELSELEYTPETATMYSVVIPVDRAVLSRRYTNTGYHDTGKCGPVAQTGIDVTVRRYPYWSWRFFLPGKHRASIAFPGAKSIRAGAKLRLE